MKLVIGDIHGYYSALQALLDFASPGAADPICPLGDLIDRGNEAKQVLHWARTSPNVHSLLGNHEEMWLNVLRSSLGCSLNHREQALAISWMIKGNGAIDTLESLGFSSLGAFLNQPTESLNDWKDWLEMLPLWQEVDGSILAHAGIDSTQPLTAQSREFLLWNREWMHSQIDPPVPNKILLVGHTPTWSLRHWIEDFQPGDLVGGRGWINLDTGSAIPEVGWLSALDIDTDRVFQVNLSTLKTRFFDLPDCLKSLSRHQMP